MIQNVSATQSRQNFGMAVKVKEDFPQKLVNAYSGKHTQEIEKITNTLKLVKKAQENIHSFNLHLDFDKRNKLTYEIKDRAGEKVIQKHKWSRFILSILPDHLKLKCLSSIITYNDKKLSTLQKIGKKMLSENPEERANGSLVV